ncbi:MAG: ATP-binding protein [Bryobacterales bacterium]|nr:ATP-binding protein [Bryobacterales bacterium]
MRRPSGEVRTFGGTTDVPLIGLLKEKSRIEQAMRRGESLLVLGPAGSGKTTIVRAVAASTKDAVYVTHRPVLHDMLVSLATALIANRHPCFDRIVKGGTLPDRWASEQTSVCLRGLICNGLEANPCLLVLDNIAGSSFQAYRFFQRVKFTEGMRMIAVSRDPFRLGEMHRLFWDPRGTIQMMPLSEADASALFELAADCFGLRKFDLSDFRPRVLENAKGNPGQIVEICRMARHPQYQSGKHLMFAPLRIDLMTRYLG